MEIFSQDVSRLSLTKEKILKVKAMPGLGTILTVRNFFAEPFGQDVSSYALKHARNAWRTGRRYANMNFWSQLKGKSVVYVENEGYMWTNSMIGNRVLFEKPDGTYHYITKEAILDGSVNMCFAAKYKCRWITWDVIEHPTQNQVYGGDRVTLKYVR